MRKIIADPGWGNLIVEDDETHEISLQCLSGGFAMYWHRVVLTPEEVLAFKTGQLDIDNMVREINHGAASMASRISPSYDVAELEKNRR